MSRMRIAVVGTGAMGSIYAARFAAAGADVLALVRNPATAEHLSRYGLRVDGPDGTLHAAVRAATRAPREEMDLVVLAVKAADVDTAAQGLAPLVGPATVVLTIQNGLGSADTVADAVGADRVAVGIASGFGAATVAPGHVVHNAMKAVRMGAHSTLPESELRHVASLWAAAGFDAEVVPDIAVVQWEKLLCNVAFSAPCAITGLTVGGILDDPALWAVGAAAATEAWTVARACGVDISVEDPVEHARAFGAAMPAAKPSALSDREARRVGEIDSINGAVPRYGARVGVPTPVNAALTALVRGIERSWRDAPTP